MTNNVYSKTDNVELRNLYLSICYTNINGQNLLFKWAKKIHIGACGDKRVVLDKLFLHTSVDNLRYTRFYC